jgi:hypothetical protein
MNFFSINAFIKGLILLCRPHLYLFWLRHLTKTISNTIELSKWISKQEKHNTYNDFYSPLRDYQKRYKLYEYVVDRQGLKNEPFEYLEFGVCQGASFRWWMEHCIHPQSRFFGFDTFEGLPEKWGVFDKGDMSANIPLLSDNRGKFIKGLFQETLPSFLEQVQLDTNKRKIIHLDADLFSSTLYALTSLAPYLKKGDILLFDEFNVPNHEFSAFKIFCDTYYFKTQLLAAVNNYYQVAMVIIDCPEKKKVF